MCLWSMAVGICRAAESFDAVVGEVVEFAIVGAEGVGRGGAFVGERGEEVFGELG